MKKLEQRLEIAAQNNSSSYAVLLLDLNRFHWINDALGYESGDLVLKYIAKSLEEIAGESAILARLGADEFAILLDQASVATLSLEEFIECFRMAMQEPFLLEGHAFHLTFSIASVSGNARYQRAEEILRDARIALRSAKQQGFDSYQAFTPKRAIQGAQLLALEADLRKALLRDELELHYQPIVSLQDGQIVGAEALVRWRHPVKGLIPPGDFIPLAEDTGLILSLDAWTLQTACLQAKSWQEAELGALWMAVNVSPIQFFKADIGALVQQSLASSRLDPSCLKLELTERTVVRDMEKTSVILRELRDLGIQLSLDDFGTGYSSLSYLKKLPFSTLKIDRSFVMDLAQNQDSQAIAKAILQLGHTLRQSVTAEGVEKTEQMEFLKNHGCDELQGWLFSKALPVPEFETLLRSGKRLMVA